jgi:hypothetical protein
MIVYFICFTFHILFLASVWCLDGPFLRWLFVGVTICNLLFCFLPLFLIRWRSKSRECELNKVKESVLDMTLDRGLSVRSLDAELL